MAADRSPSGRPCWTGRPLGESEGGCRDGSLAWTWMGFGCASARVVENSGGGATWWVKQPGSRRGNGRHACWKEEEEDCCNIGSDGMSEAANVGVWIWRRARHAPSLQGNRRDQSGPSAASQADDRRTLGRGDGEGLEWAGWTRQRGSETQRRRWELSPIDESVVGEEGWAGYMWRRWPSNPAGRTRRREWGSRA
jgi:hypothetical protein